MNSKLAIISILILSAISGIIVWTQLSHVKYLNLSTDQAAIRNQSINTLAKIIATLGGEASIHDKENSVTLIETPERCIPYINQIPSVHTFFLGSSKTVISEPIFLKLRVFSETKIFHILYGTLSKKAFSKLAIKFPHIQELILWGQMDSDLSELPSLNNLRTFKSDMEHLITENEARRLFLSKSLESIDIDNASSTKVIEILRDLPNLKHLQVIVYTAEGHPRTFGIER